MCTTSRSARISHGFTLIELVVVIIILSLLAAIAIPQYLDMRKQAQVAAMQTIVATLRANSNAAVMA